MCVTILWDNPRPLLLSLLHLVSRGKKWLQIDLCFNHFACIVIRDGVYICCQYIHSVASLFSYQIKQKKKFQSCISDLISTGTVSLSAWEHFRNFCSNVVNEGASD